jgi:trehalose-phosphatase
VTTTNGAGFSFQNTPDFWRQVRDAPWRLLGLDYDGTLAPFSIEPMLARPLTGIADLLRNLSAGGQTEVAILSGRPAHEVVTLLGNPPLTVVGSHGFEWWPATGEKLNRLPTPEQQHGLAVIRDALQRCGRGHKLEVKIASLALHTRGMDPIVAVAVEQEVVAEWGTWALQYGLEWRWFNGGVEVRCTGWNKGDALARLLDRQPPNTMAVYIGDDDTDEDAFVVLRERGLGIKVGYNGKPTAARAHLTDCIAVADFLRTYLAATEAT